MSAVYLNGLKLDQIPAVTLGEFFFNSAAKFGDRICQVDANTDQHESFSSVKLRSTRVAIEMQKRGITSDDVVVLCSSSTVDAAIPLLATFYLGAKIANLDITLSVRQVSHLLSLVSPKMIFVEESAVGLIEESVEKLGYKTEIVIIGNSEKYSTFSDFVQYQENEQSFRPIVVDLNEPAILFFSSGTTGLPKAVCHTNSTFLNIGLCFYHSNSKLDIILSFTSFYWITAMFFFTATFIGGGHRIICGNKVIAEKTFQLIEQYKVTYMFLAPILTYPLTNFENYEKYDTSSLYTLLTSGTPLSVQQFNKLSQIFKHTNIIGCYGQTETGVISLFNPPTDAHLIRPKGQLQSPGKVIAGITLKIVDTETNEVLGANQKGEICIKSKSIMKGYYNSNTPTICDQDGFLKTGDIGYFDSDECLYVIERVKEMFKYLSWHIVPSAIEAVLYEHLSIKEAIVFGIPVSEEEGEVPAASIVVHEGSSVDKEEIKQFVADRVSDREKLRGGVFIVPEMPKTPSGKIIRREIKDMIIKSCNNMPAEM